MTIALTGPFGPLQAQSHATRPNPVEYKQAPFPREIDASQAKQFFVASNNKFIYVVPIFHTRSQLKTFLVWPKALKSGIKNVW